MADLAGVGLVGELIELQRAHNEWLRTATPEEIAANARATLRHIAEVEDDTPEWYADA